MYRALKFLRERELLDYLCKLDNSWIRKSNVEYTVFLNT